jgi:hypothetical protein
MQLRLGCDSVDVKVTGLKSATVYGIQVVDMTTGRVLKVLPTKSTSDGTITASGRVDLRGVKTVDAIVWDRGGDTKTMAIKDSAATNCAVAGLAVTGPTPGLGPAGAALMLAGALLLIATRRRRSAREDA